MRATGHFRDTVRIEFDSSPEGADKPTYAELFSCVPCHVNPTRGDESWRGRKLTENVDYVLTLWYTPRLDRLKTTDRIEITSGLYKGQQLNVSFVKTIPRKDGMRALTDIFCRTVDGK